MVVSNIFYFHPYLGKIPILTNIFQMGWNHQLEWDRILQIFPNPPSGSGPGGVVKVLLQSLDGVQTHGLRNKLFLELENSQFFWNDWWGFAYMLKRSKTDIIDIIYTYTYIYIYIDTYTPALSVYPFQWFPMYILYNFVRITVYTYSRFKYTLTIEWIFSMSLILAVWPCFHGEHVI